MTIAPPRIVFLLAVILLCPLNNTRAQDADWQIWSSMFLRTVRPDRNEHRLMAGLFWRHSLGKERFDIDDEKIIITHQLMYEYDFNAKFNDILVNSNSIRYVFWAIKPINKTVAPFAAVAGLYTWNKEYAGLEKLRFVAGFRFSRGNTDRIKIHYVYEKRNSVDPAQFANLIWLRYEILIR